MDLTPRDGSAQAADDPADFLGLGEEAIERGLVQVLNVEGDIQLRA